MEASVILFGPSSVSLRDDELVAACKEFEINAKKLLIGTKYKPLQIWVAEVHNKDLRYRLVSSLFGKPMKVYEAATGMAWCDGITKYLPSKPTKRNPLFVTIYSTDALTVSPTWEFEIKYFDYHLKGFGLSFVYELEFRPHRVAELAVFSATANPVFRSLTQPRVDNLTPNLMELPEGSKAFIQGLALGCENLSAEVSFGNGSTWLLALENGVAKLHELSRQDVLQTLGYKEPDLSPFVMDPANPIVFQLFKLIQLLDAGGRRIDPATLRNFELILNSFVDKILKDDGQLFPVYGTNFTAISLNGKRVIRSLRWLNTKHKDLKSTIDNVLKRYDADDRASNRVKKPRPQSETFVDSSMIDFRMRPYLELLVDPRVVEIPQAKENSLFNVYWKMQGMSQKVLISKYKRFWE